MAVYAYCADNFGDDIFIRQLVSRYPTVRFEFFASAQSTFLASRSGIQIGALDFAQFKKHAHDYDLLLVLGGSMFQQVGGWPLQVAGYARRFLVAKRNNVPIAVVGASFGPPRTRIFQLAYSTLFRMCDWVSFRDHESASKFAGNPVVKQFPDLALAFPARIPPVRAKTLAISVLDVGPDSGAYESGMARIITELCTDFDIELYSFQESRFHSDSAVARRILGRCDPHVRRQTRIINYTPTTFDQFTDEFLSCERFLATRFHSLILGTLTGRPVVAIAYHQKTPDTIATLNIPIPLFYSDEVDHRADEIIAAVRSGSWQGTATAPTEAAKHFTFVDSILD